MNRLFAKGLAVGAACLTGLALMAPGPAAAADVALVIGNYDYRQAPDALSARIDARAVAEALERGGYEVISGTDLGRSQMRSRIKRFAERVEGADRAVVFYSGHALRTGGQSYLAPVGQNNSSLVQVMMDGVPLELVMRVAAEASGRAVVFVDGAQLDGFTPRSFAEPGLAHIDPPDGVLVVSAAAPGRAIPRRAERRSGFASQVIDEFLAPGASLGQAVRNLESPAWVGGDTDSSLVLVPEDRVATGGGAERDDADDGTQARSAADVEARLGLTRTERIRIQKDLTQLGYDTRGTEGIFGPGTRRAIRRWQQNNDVAASGYLTADQLATLHRQGRQARTGASASTPAEVEARLNLTRAERSEIQERLNILDYDTRGTGGTFGAGTRSAIRGWQRANDFEATGYLTQEQVSAIYQQSSQARAGAGDLTPAEVEARLDLTASERSEIQERLNILGYDTRGTDGTFGAGTRTAIRNWQRANDFQETGYLTDSQASLIFEQSSQASAGSGGRTPAEVEAGLNLSVAERSEIQRRLVELGYDTRGTRGTFGAGTRTAIRNWQRANDFQETGYLTGDQISLIFDQTDRAGTGTGRQGPSDPAAAEEALGLDRTDRLSIEQRLAHLGFPPGPQDGFFNADTRAAIEGYQRSRGYAATGYLDRQTVRGIVQETQDARTGIVTGAQVLFDILRGLSNQD